MPADIGKITAKLDLDTSDFDRAMTEVKRRLVGSPLLVIYSYAATAIASALIVLLVVAHA
jgi:hypothetical protein